ncbi:MAG TPA: 30S ribosomal protein S12 methylthiotransferase RimO [Lachnospiraceae bacterium]|nr:30S ribosomal protein S12 methylthiotransferase RimO [Lachnospiraceae bacterium]
MQILFVSLGCDKNLVDSEVMLGLLEDKGYAITNEEKEADVVVINTCCFIGDAKEESIENIIEMGKLKQTGKLKALIVTGCLAQRYKDEIQAELPEVDAIVGTTATEAIVEAVEETLKGKGYTHFEDINYLPPSHTKRVITSGTYMGYLKIAEGCDKHCTYCIIPKVRGNYRSVPMPDLIEQAKYLVENGITELCLVAQETTVYGVDIYGKKMLPELLHELSKIEDLQWIRLLYCYPEEITPELIYEIRDNAKVCHYIDMPLQHCEDSILKRMGRRTTKEEILNTIRMIRKEIPDIVLRTSLIAGFPGETQEEHEALLAFIDEVEFNRLGVFTYSPEEGTPAAAFEDQVPEETKETWRDEIMALQQEISYDLNSALVGKQMRVIVDGYIYKDQMYMCRSYMDAPGIDGCVFVASEEELLSGDFIDVKVTDFNEYDLIGERV